MSKANSTINFRSQVNMREASRLINICGGEITFLFQGEPGIGKSTILSMLEHADTTQKYDYVYIDCPTIDLPDVAQRIPVHASKQLEVYVSSLLKMNSTKPKIIMLDEFMKCTNMMKLMFLRLILEHVVGDVALPAGSKVFGTSNNQTDGVGDSMLAHASNRMTIIPMSKPNVKEWLTWATDAGIDALIRSWVALNGNVLDSYVDMDADSLNSNPYIFNPAKKILSYASPRSIAKCESLIRNRVAVGDQLRNGEPSVVETALAGTVGSAAARNLMTFLGVEQFTHKFEDIIANPHKISVPDNGGAIWFMLNKAIDLIKTQDELTNFMIYVKRLPNIEYQSVFFTMCLGSKKTARLAQNNVQLKSWAVANYDLMLA